MLNDQENGNGNDNDDEIKNESNRKNNKKGSMTVGQHHSSVSHPAHLTPLLATQDSSLKILQILSALLDTTGCALLLGNKSNRTSHPNYNLAAVSTDTVYQGICTGTGFHWCGLPVGVFGNIVISKPNKIQNQDPRSLIESCMISGQTLALKDGTSDPRYCYLTDGNFLSESPYMVTPIRGREGTIVGVLLALRKRGSVIFSQVRKQKNEEEDEEEEEEEEEEIEEEEEEEKEKEKEKKRGRKS